MDRSLPGLLTLAALLTWAAPAHAQFANRSLGLSLGYMDFHRAGGLDAGYFVGLEGSYYLEAGFELVSLSKLTFPRDPASGLRVVGIAPSIGIRYLLVEESFRPYVGTDLSYLHLFKPEGSLGYVGLGPNVGAELFVSHTISVGARAQYNVYVMLNTPTQTSLTLSLGAAAYF